MPADVARGFYHLLRREAAREREEMDAAAIAERERQEMAKLQRASGMG